jgi:hypothetical protein
MSAAPQTHKFPAAVDLALVRHARARFLTTLASEIGRSLAQPRDPALPAHAAITEAARRHQRLTSAEIDALFRDVVEIFPEFEERADYGVATTIRFLTKIEREHNVRLLNMWRPL